MKSEFPPSFNLERKEIYDAYAQENLGEDVNLVRCPQIQIGDCQISPVRQINENEFFIVSVKKMFDALREVNFVFKVRNGLTVGLEVQEVYEYLDFNHKKYPLHRGNFHNRSEYKSALSAITKNSVNRHDELERVILDSGLFFHKKITENARETYIYATSEVPYNTFSAELGANLGPDIIWFLHLNYKWMKLVDIETMAYSPTVGHDRNLFKDQLQKFTSSAIGKRRIWPKYELR